MRDFEEGRSLGRHYRVYFQRRNDSCGCACIRNAVGLVAGVAPTEQAVRDLTRQGNRMVAPGVQAAIAALGMAAVDQGTFVTDLVRPLRSLGCTAAVGTEARSMLELGNESTRHTVFIVKIAWTAVGSKVMQAIAALGRTPKDLGTQGAHWVVVAHAQGGSVTVLDSIYGLQTVTAPRAYTPTGTVGSLQPGVTAAGQFDGDYLQVTRGVAH